MSVSFSEFFSAPFFWLHRFRPILYRFFGFIMIRLTNKNALYVCFEVLTFVDFSFG